MESQEVNPTDVVWAKVKYCSFWPARLITHPPKEIQVNGKSGQICVFFFGSKEFAFVESANIKSYVENRQTYIKKCKRTKFIEAVQQCDDFLRDPREYRSNAFIISADEVVTVQTALDFQIKIEPIDDEPFHQAKVVSIIQQENMQSKQNESSKMPENVCTRSMTRVITTQNKSTAIELEEPKSDYKMHLMALEKMYDDQSKTINQLLNGRQMAGTSKGSLTIQLMDVNKQPDKKTEEYSFLVSQLQSTTQTPSPPETAEMEIMEHEKSLERYKADNDKQISDLNEQLVEKCTKIDHMIDEKRTLENSIRKIKDENDIQVATVNAKFEVKTKQYESVLDASAKQASEHEESLKLIKGQYDSEIDDLKKQLLQKGSEIDVLKQSESEFGNQIADLKEQLVERDTKIDGLMNEKRSLENSIREMKNENDTQMANVNGKFKEKSQQYDLLLAELKKKKIDHEASLKLVETECDNKIGDLKKQLLQKSSEIDGLKQSESELGNRIAHLKEQLVEKDTKIDGFINEKRSLENSISGMDEKLNNKSQEYNLLLQEKKLNVESLEKKVSYFEESSKRYKTEYGNEIIELKKRLMEKNERQVTKTPDTPRRRQKRREIASTSKTLVKVTSPKKVKTVPKSDFEVEKLINHEEENGKRNFLVKWKNFGSDSNSWVPENDLSCPAVLKKYKQKNNLN